MLRLPDISELIPPKPQIGEAFTIKLPALSEDEVENCGVEAALYVIEDAVREVFGDSPDIRIQCDECRLGITVKSRRKLYLYVVNPDMMLYLVRLARGLPVNRLTVSFQKAVEYPATPNT